MFLGATIHDVAQVVGAGYSISPAAGDTATLVKLMRVAMLLPVIMLAASVTRARGDAKIEHDPEYWADQTMFRLLDAVAT